MVNVRDKKINYLTLKNRELKLLIEKLLQNLDTENLPQSTVWLLEENGFLGGEQKSEPVVKCSDCNTPLGGNPSLSRNNSRRCGKCYLKYKAEQRKQKGRR